MFPEGEIEYAEPGSVQIVYGKGGWFANFRDPQTGTFIRKDGAIENLGFDPISGEWYDSFGNTIGVGAFGPSTAPYTYSYKYKDAVYSAWERAPEKFTPSPGATLQVRVVAMDETGRLYVIYKSFGENKKWSADVEQQMIGEALSETVPGGKTVNIFSPPFEGILLRKDYTVQRVSTRKLGP